MVLNYFSFSLSNHLLCYDLLTIVNLLSLLCFVFYYWIICNFLIFIVWQNIQTGESSSTLLATEEIYFEDLQPQSSIQFIDLNQLIEKTKFKGTALEQNPRTNHITSSSNSDWDFINTSEGYECKLCSYKNKNKTQLQRHMHTHTKTKPFKCSYCDDSFTLKSNLKVHLRKHTGEKPFHCQFCNEAYGDLSRLRSHLKNHTQGYSYPCDLCNEYFTTSKELKIHKRVHLTLIKLTKNESNWLWKK